jgi:Ca-activated chloride channel family protein
MSIDENDPRLTAYALGDLDDAERTQVESELADSPEAREAVEDIRRTADLLQQELQAEPAAAMSHDQRCAIDAQTSSPLKMPRSPRSRGRLWRPVAIAASFLLVCGLA